MAKTWLEVNDRATDDDVAGAAKVVQEGDGVCIRAIHLYGDGAHDIVVAVEFPERPGEWVEVIREHVATPYGEPHAVSHIVEPAGLRTRRETAKAASDPAAGPTDEGSVEDHAGSVPEHSTGASVSQPQGRATSQRREDLQPVRPAGPDSQGLEPAHLDALRRAVECDGYEGHADRGRYAKEAIAILQERSRSGTDRRGGDDE